MSNTPNMNLIVPDPGLTDGPTWAQNLNSDLTLIDAHSHAAGYGVLVPVAGLDINADFPLNNNNLITARTLRFQAQSATPALGTDLGALYLTGVDLYYIDGAGNNIRITQSGSVAGSAGTITGLPSGTASASYSASVFTFQAATSTAANLDVGSVVLRNNTASSYGLTLAPPNAMGANYSLVLPAIPAQTNVLTLDTSGNISSITYDAVGVAMTATGANAVLASVTTFPATQANLAGVAMTSTGANAIGVSMTATGANAVAATRTRATGTSVAAGGVAISASSGSFSTSSTSQVAVTNLSVTVVTSGRPVQLMLIPDGAGNTLLGIGTNSGSPAGGLMGLEFYRGVTGLGSVVIDNNTGSGTAAYVFTVPPASMSAIDVVAAGTYTYTVKTAVGGSTVKALVQQIKLVAYEL